jgi:hypothetical protein
MFRSYKFREYDTFTEIWNKYHVINFYRVRIHDGLCGFTATSLLELLKNLKPTKKKK